MRKDKFMAEEKSLAAETADHIIEKEWKMFQTVNGDLHASCQENPQMFHAMRSGQLLAWDQSPRENYLQDLTEAEAAGRNLLREKYIYMMSRTDPDQFEALKDQVQAVSDQKLKLVQEISSHLLKQTEKFRKEFPYLTLMARPLYSAEESGKTDTSIETYQMGEFLTYSERTLKSLLAYVIQQENEGVELAREIETYSVRQLGYESLAAADAYVKSRVAK